MKNTFKFERYTFAAILLIFAAIILISMLQIPSETNVSGIIVKEAETTTKEVSVSDASELINLNTATLSELDSLEGIGEVRASNIIAYREKLGGYTSVEQIKDIRGISGSVFDKIKDKITV